MLLLKTISNKFSILFDIQFNIIKKKTISKNNIAQ